MNVWTIKPEQLHYYAQEDALAQAVATRITNIAQQCITAQGCFHLALAGGTSPKQCYTYLRHANIDWPRVHIWFGDERCLPIGDSERNDIMAQHALLDHVDIPASQIHRMATELGAVKAANAYQQALQNVQLDLVLLGMGEDGHTASLFPGNIALEERKAWAVPVFHAPKPPAERVSLSYRAIEHAKMRIMMVSGEGKRDVFGRILQGETFPICIANSEWHSTLKH